MKTARKAATLSIVAPSALRESSPQSFHSARTIGSSPISNGGSTNGHPTPLYRTVRPLPYELCEHVMIYFEEGLYCQALNFLKAVLTSGMISSVPQPATLPPSQQLALIATLSVHPALTTRAKSADLLEAANLALQYLKLVLRHIGPINDVVRDAFVFTSQNRVNRRGTTTRRKTIGDVESPTADFGDGLTSEFANAGSLWSRAESFWQLVGWSFNSSVLHKHRWERWSALLSLLLETLEMDWNFRKANFGSETLEQSLIVRYITSYNAVAGMDRKILRAVFADGQAKATAEFGEIWQNETKVLKKDGAVKKTAEKIDIEADNYGDYMEDENDADLEDSDAEPSSPPAELGSHSNGPISDIDQHLGGIDSVNLRIRFLSLLSKIAEAIPDTFTSLNNLYQNFFEHIRPLPIPTFFCIISPVGLSHFEPTAASTLTQYILRSIIAAAAPLPPNDDLSQETLEGSYLPFTANTSNAEDNIKVSLCVETLLRLLDQHVGLEWTPELQDRADAGIKARADKAKGKRTKKRSDRTKIYEETWLVSSAERIKMVIEMARP